jgi:enoyl-CoA hydratase/carnithine racemase
MATPSGTSATSGNSDHPGELLRTRVEDGVCWATVDAPPLNVLTVDLLKELNAFARRVAGDDEVRAVVLQSAHPDFFIAHFDVGAILSWPTEGGPAPSDGKLSGFHRMCETFRTMGKATLVKVAGRVGGGGAELAASCDMRFGLLDRTVLNQMEVPLGILPGGSGTQRLPHLVGRGRALEIVLGGIDVDAATLERWGWLNRAFATHDELDTHVDDLARRIAAFPPMAVRLAKEAVDAAAPDPVPGLLREGELFEQLRCRDDAQATMRRFLDQGGQTDEGERRMGQLNLEINRPR